MLKKSKIYISWSVSNPIIQLIPQSVQETYGNPILVEANVVNKSAEKVEENQLNHNGTQKDMNI